MIQVFRDTREGRLLLGEFSLLDDLNKARVYRYRTPVPVVPTGIQRVSELIGIVRSSSGQVFRYADAFNDRELRLVGRIAPSVSLSPGSRPSPSPLDEARVFRIAWGKERLVAWCRFPSSRSAELYRSISAQDRPSYIRTLLLGQATITDSLSLDIHSYCVAGAISLILGEL